MTCAIGRIMNGFPFYRVFIALLVMLFLVALPMRGTSMAGSPGDTQVAWTTDAELPGSKACNGCPTAPAMLMVCPIIFCGNLARNSLAMPEFDPRLLISRLRSTLTTDIGLLSTAPDPHPPRLSI